MTPAPTHHQQGQSFDVSVGHPPTSTRIPAIDADKHIAKPGVPRANAAVTAAAPNGDREYSERYKQYVRMRAPPNLSACPSYTCRHVRVMRKERIIEY